MKIVLWLAAAMLSLASGSRLTLAQDTPVLKLGTEGTYAPFSYYSADGKLTGFDVEISQALCQAAKLKCEFVTLDFEGMIPALEQSKLDAVVAGLAITEKRKKLVAFTDSYRSSDKRFVACNPEQFKEVSAEALKGRIIGTQSGTSSVDYLRSHYSGSDIRFYKSMDEAFQDLAAGRLDLAMATIPVGFSFTSKPENKACQFVGPPIKDAMLFGSGVGIAFRKSDTAMVEKFNAALKMIRENGTYEAINRHYFPFSIY